ncbi:MAG TPA: DUF1003 domain-containing protein [Candidatus Dormibacteraeota bacterium]
MTATPVAADEHYRRFIKDHDHLSHPFGEGGFGQKAEAFARFFGTPRFLIGQTLVVGTWIVLNALQIIKFDVYPFILLNLAFSLQAAYAAPLILLAQTRQADRDKAQADADARHREAVAQDTLTRQALAEATLNLLKRLLDENTALTKRIDELTSDIHHTVVAPSS